MARKCSVDGCERTPGAGWARCHSHVAAWLDRLLKVPGRDAWRLTQEEIGEYAASDWTVSVPENELRALYGDK